jgi:long-chain fatty acid transport protein
MRKSWRLILIGCGFWGTQVQADQFHYHNLVVGERAMGLGGAFSAIADDASGVIYNPAGIGFALSSDISGSANAIYSKKTVYKKTIANDDFTEESSGTLSPFFGGLQKLDSTMQGLAMAFAMYSLDSELKDQDDIIENIGTLERFHRTSNIRSNTTGYGVGAAKRMSGNFSLGVSLSWIVVDELVQEYQDVQYTNGGFLAQNLRTHLTASALDSAIGAQYAVGTLSFGLTMRLRNIMSENYEVGGDVSTNLANGTTPGDTVRANTNDKVKEPFGELPTEVRAGVAWFPSAVFLWSFDVIHNTAAEGDNFKREAVTNFATGTEYYITPSIPVRAGIFTNYDTRPEVESDRRNQPDHIDYMGYSLFFGWVQPNSQVAGGLVVQDGEGKAQKIGNSSNIQTVESRSYTFALSATHSF